MTALRDLDTINHDKQITVFDTVRTINLGLHLYAAVCATDSTSASLTSFATTAQFATRVP